jgi:hypothetical protein
VLLAHFLQYLGAKAIREVHSASAQAFEGIAGRFDQSGATCPQDEAHGAAQGDAQGLRATAALKVVDDGGRSGVGQRPRQHGRFTGAEIPRQDVGRYGDVIRLFHPGRGGYGVGGHIARAAGQDLACYRRRYDDRLCRLPKQIHQAGATQADER